MWNLGEYSKHPQRLADHLPWATLIAPGVMLNKDGSLQKTIAFRGPDLDSSTPYELVAARARMNNVLRRLGSHWCVHVEASRRLAHVHPASDFPNPVAAMIDQERRDSFTADALHFESQCFITFTYLPPAEGMTRLGDFFIDRPNNKVDGRVSYRAHFDHFLGQVDQIVNLMASFMPEVHPLDDGATLTYLHSCISDRRLTVAVPDVPFYLDEMITDRPLAGGLSPRLGRLFLKTVSVRAYVNRTLPCLLDRLNELPIEYRWIGRYLPMDKTDATRQLNKLRRQWFAKRKGMVTLLKEAITKQESKLEDSDSLNKSEDVDAALQELGGDHCSFGDFTLTITVWDEDEQTATEKARAVQQVVDGVGLVTEIEDFNAVAASPAGLAPLAAQAFPTTLPCAIWEATRRRRPRIVLQRQKPEAQSPRGNRRLSETGRAGAGARQFVARGLLAIPLSCVSQAARLDHRFPKSFCLPWAQMPTNWRDSPSCNPNRSGSLRPLALPRHVLVRLARSVPAHKIPLAGC